MNHIQYLDLLLESPQGRWAVVKNVPINTWEYFGGSEGQKVPFMPDMKQFIGKRLFLYPSEFYKGLWKDEATGWYYHPDWLDFKDEEQLNLFTRDPKPAKAHWHSAGEEQ
jgi:hypothetical protein